jgi:hypothetical protein
VKLFLLAALVLSLAGVGAQEVLAPSLFVATDPLGANLRVDDQPRSETTPVLLRGLGTGVHQLLVYKAGYRAERLTVTIVAGKTASITITMAPDSVVAAFPANTVLEIAGSNRSTTGLQFRLPGGRYDLSTEGTTVKAEPVFEDEALLTLAPWLGLGLVSVAAGSAGIDLYFKSQNWGGLTPFTPLLWASAAVELAWYWALSDRRTRWEKSRMPTYGPLAQEGAEKAVFSTALAERANLLLSEGDLVGSEAVLSRLVHEYPEAYQVPGAWFRLARIHALKGERELAQGEYRLVAETLQDPEWYDRAHKALADFALADAQPEKALYHLRQLTFVDGYFEPAVIAAQIDELVKGTPNAP